MSARLLLALPLVALAAPALAAPPSWAPVKAQSQIGFSGTHAGNPFKGSFGQWDATIAFDPKDLAHSSAKVSFATASAKTGDELQESSLKQDEWLNPAKFPTATFATSAITAAGGNKYIAKGTLTIKGKARPVSLPFTLDIKGDTATMKGSLTVDRLVYDLGAKSDAGGQWVSKQIGISVSLVAKRGK